MLLLFCSSYYFYKLNFHQQLNCVVMRGLNDDELHSFVELTRDKEIDVRYIEYMPFEGNKWNDKKMVPYLEMLEIIRKKYDLRRLDDAPNDTSKVCFNISYSISVFYSLPGISGLPSTWLSR